MAPDLDAPASGSNGVPGCYRDTVDKNTGVIAVRATPNGIATMAEWKVRLQVGEKDEQDQTTFNDLLDGNGRGHRWGMNWQQRSAFHQFADTWCGRPRRCEGTIGCGRETTRRPAGVATRRWSRTRAHGGLSPYL